MAIAPYRLRSRAITRRKVPHAQRGGGIRLAARLRRCLHPGARPGYLGPETAPAYLRLQADAETMIRSLMAIPGAPMTELQLQQRERKAHLRRTLPPNSCRSGRPHRRCQNTIRRPSAENLRHADSDPGPEPGTVACEPRTPPHPPPDTAAPPPPALGLSSDSRLCLSDSSICQARRVGWRVRR